MRTAQERDRGPPRAGLRGYLAGLEPHIDRHPPIATYVMVAEPLGARLRDCVNTDAAVVRRASPSTTTAAAGHSPAVGRAYFRCAIARRRRCAICCRDLLRVYPQLDGVRIDYAWSGLMSYARHQMPQIGRRAGTVVRAGLRRPRRRSDDGSGRTAGRNHRQRRQRPQRFAPFGLASAHRPIGFAAAQASYWWYQLKDAWKGWREG